MRALLLPFSLIAIGLCAFGVRTAHAAVDVFLKIDGIPGEAASESHKNWIELVSFQTGVTNPPGTNQSFSTEITTAKIVDKATPKLMEACARGQLLDKVAVEFIREGARGKVQFCRIEMENVMVTSYGHRVPAKGNSVATEEVTLSAEGIALSYVQFDESDRLLEDTKAYWDFLRGEGGIIRAFNMIARQEGSTIVITWPAEEGRTYRVLGSSSVDGIYGVQETITAPETGPLSTAIPMLPAHRFFLVEELP